MKFFKSIIATILICILIFSSVFAGNGNKGFEVGKLTGKSNADKGTIALEFMSKKLTDGEFKIKNKEKDKFGLTTIRIQQYFNNVPVWGSDQIVNIAEDGVVESYIGSIKNLSDKLEKKIDKSINKPQSINIAKTDLGFTPSLSETPKVDVVVYSNNDITCYAYQVELVFDEPAPGRWFYFIDTATGEIVNKFNSAAGAKPIKGFDVGNTETGTGTDVLGNTRTFNTNYHTDGNYYLVDLTRGNGIYTYNAKYRTRLPGSLWIDEDNMYNTSYDSPAVSSQYFLGVTYDYYMNKFNRNSFDNNGALIKSSVHVGRDYNNAYWNGSQFAFGDGDGNIFFALSGGIDIVAHEFTHAVTEYTAGLIYQNESGALNEAISDIFGTAIEFYANENPDWLIGEDISGPGLGSIALRSLADPTESGDPDHYSNIYVGTSDYGGVHTNCGVINKVAYLIGAGGNHYGVNVQGQGIDVMENVFYRALTTYMTSGTNFSLAKQACVQSAIDLYGAGSQEVQAVQNAFTACGIN